MINAIAVFSLKKYKPVQHYYWPWIWIKVEENRRERPDKGCRPDWGPGNHIYMVSGKAIWITRMFLMLHWHWTIWWKKQNVFIFFVFSPCVLPYVDSVVFLLFWLEFKNSNLRGLQIFAFYSVFFCRMCAVWNRFLRTAELYYFWVRQKNYLNYKIWKLLNRAVFSV